MTIFDKLSGFAHKAKENALSRAILAKDKRLDKSISEALDADTIGLSKMSTFGIPGRVSAVAFDPVAGLLAVGGGKEPDTYIRIFGKGISAALTLNSETRIKYMKFQTGHPILAAVDMKNVVTTYDLRTKKPRHVVTTPSIVTSLEHVTGTDWLLVGFADGNVDLFDMDMGVFSEEYGIPNLCVDETQEPQPHNIVVAIQMHPTDLDLVLIGYESAIYLWSIRDQVIKKQYIHKGDTRMTCLTWSPDGTRFMAGYDNGYMHLWEVRSDVKPLLSRRVFHSSPSEECEPIFQMEWYIDDAARKSFLVVAGGSDLPDIRGLHVMEYDLDSHDARKQTILSTSVEVQDFILLSREPYFLGMHNPLGLLVIGVDGAIRAYGLDHGHPPLTLPPALQFLDPPVQQAYYVSQLPHPVFQKLIHQHSEQELYLPLHGGVAGNGHIYRIPSNDLLVTVHGESTLRFWDASYTSLRPLSHRTLYCQDQLPQHTIQCIELDRWSGSVLVVMDNGVILVYTPDSIEERQQRSSGVQEKFLESCDNTLQEISQLLEDMNDDTAQDTTAEQHTSTPPPPDQEAAKNVDPLQSTDFPKETPSQTSDTPTNEHSPENPDSSKEVYAAKDEDIPKDADTPKDEERQSSSSMPPRPAPEQQSVKVELLDKPIDHSGFTLTMKITLEEGTVSKIVSSEKALFAFSTSNGSTYVVDGLLGKVVFSTDLKGDSNAAVVASDGNSISTEGSGGKEPSVKSSPPAPIEASIAQIGLYPSYSPNSLKAFHTVPQLYIGLSNGATYQHDISTPESQPILIPPSSSSTSIISIHMIDIQGKPPTTTTGPVVEPVEEEPMPRKSSEDKPEKKAEGLLRKTTRKFSKGGRNRSNSQSQPAPPLPNMDQAPPLPASDEPGELNSPSGSKRVTAGRWDYTPQPNPHYLLVVSTKSIATFLSGYNTRLFHIDLQSTPGCTEQDSIVHSQVMSTDEGGSCLAVVLLSGQIIFYTLPHLNPLAKISLPADFVASKRLNDMSLSTDGRIVLWTGAYELEQFLVLLQTNLPRGDAVVLFNPSLKLPPHPVQGATAQKPKKSWLDTVQGAFQKGPVTVTEFDTIVGKRQRGLEAAQRAALMKGAQTSGASDSKAQKESGALPGVFQELGMKMNERGERLNELETKFQEVNDASGDFLKAVRDYNDRQARKKWWEF